MRSRIALLVVGSVVVLAIWAFSTVASANRLSLSDRGVRIVWNPLTAGAQTREMFGAECPVTMEGSFHSSAMSKVVGSLIGYVTRASVATTSCTRGSFRFLLESLPWHIRYSYYRGTLPNISRLGIGFVGAAISITSPPFFENSLARSTAERPMGWEAEREAGGSIRSLIAESGTILPLSGSIMCTSATFFYKGVGSVTRLGATTAVSLTLI